MCLMLNHFFNLTTWDWLAWSANYYRAALGDVLFQALPVKLRNGESAVKNDRTFCYTLTNFFSMLRI